jgi:hypothetical protein
MAEFKHTQALTGCFEGGMISHLARDIDIDPQGWNRSDKSRATSRSEGDLPHRTGRVLIRQKGFHFEDPFHAGDEGIKGNGLFEFTDETIAESPNHPLHPGNGIQRIEIVRHFLVGVSRLQGPDGHLLHAGDHESLQPDLLHLFERADRSDEG